MDHDSACRKIDLLHEFRNIRNQGIFAALSPNPEIVLGTAGLFDGRDRADQGSCFIIDLNR